MTEPTPAVSAVATTPDTRYLGTATSVGTVFRGIPYARPLTGLRRWLPPEAPEPVAEVDARAPGSACHQGQLEMGELTPLWRNTAPVGDDCLNLNVYTPDLSPARPLPVLLWFHGGGLLLGDAANPVYDGTALGRLGIVVVTANYRLGYPGWLDLTSCFPELADADNRGLRDQLAALDWVTRNIVAFGGDPAQITVAGQSAGACTALAVLASPYRTAGIRRVAALSPTRTAFVPAAEQAPVARAFCTRLGVDPGDLAGLAAAPPDRIIAAQNGVEKTLATSFDSRRYGPAARRGWGAGIATGTPTLPQDPITALRAGRGGDTDLLIGTTAQEWRFYTRMAGIPANPVSTRLLLYSLTGRLTGHRDVIRRAHRRTLNRAERHDEILTEAAFRSYAREVAAAHSSHGPTYVYRSNWSATGPLHGLGAGHTVDLPLWWNTLDSPLGRAVDGERALGAAATALSASFADFIRAGVPPHPAGSPWEPYRADLPAEVVLGPGDRFIGSSRRRAVGGSRRIGGGRVGDAG
ncbi:carboxylesterase/lipase family protein [Nocardia cyriacigeorgica]|uniref:carboxylesterase/lipase family protein n=1 Tax=Nocardia cyriacigeorgica TaxID=135487 RepID=UPI0024580142|nr:carboxylesterase family protein [Nocardia cyriacigeorgica]